jgi:hypothetical protein
MMNNTGVRQMTFKTTLGAASVAALLLAGTCANATIIDLFDEPAGDIQEVSDGTLGDGGATDTAGPFATVIGGYRTLFVEKLTDQGSSNPADNRPSAVAKLSVADGLLDFDSDALVGAFGSVTWDGDGAGLGSLIFQDGCGLAGCTAMVFDVLFADAGFDFFIEIEDVAGNSASLNGVSPGVVAPTQFAIPFDTWLQDDGTSQNQFGTLPGGGINVGFEYTLDRGGDPLIDFNNVSYIVLGLNTDGGTISLDLAIDSVTKQVPTPATLALLAAGLLGIGAAARRRNGVRG